MTMISLPSSLSMGEGCGKRICIPATHLVVPKKEKDGKEGHEEGVRAEGGCINEVLVEPGRPDGFLEEY
jgi:hypothetical protein